MEIHNDRDLATAQEILNTVDAQCVELRNNLRKFESYARKHADAIHRYAQAREEAAMNERADAIRLEREASYAELLSTKFNSYESANALKLAREAEYADIVAKVKSFDVNSLYSYELIPLETAEDFERVFTANHPALESQTYKALCDEREQNALEAATAALADAQSQLLTCVNAEGEPCADCLRQVAEAASNLAQHYA